MKISKLTILFLLTLITLSVGLFLIPEKLLKREYLIASTLVTAGLIFFFLGRHIGWFKAIFLFMLAAVIGFISEYVGLHTGQYFGGYEYTDFLGPQIVGVPILIPIAWFVALTTSYMLARFIIGFAGKVSPSIMFAAAATIAVLNDLPIEYLAKEVWGAWVWQGDGPILNVPTMNYLGWFLVAFIVYGLGSREWRTINRSASGYRDLQIVCFASVLVLLFHTTLHWLGLS